MMAERAVKRAAVVLLTAGALAACAHPASTAAPAAPVSDTSLGLVKGSVFDVPTPPGVTANESAPGELKPLPRAYVLAPPRIPHAVGDFLPITQKQNVCLDCHAVKDKRPGEPTPIPPTHYVDERHAPGQVGTEVAGARYVCVSCHAETTGAPDLVDNRFRR